MTPMRLLMGFALAAMLSPGVGPADAQGPREAGASFAQLLDTLRPEAEKRGISRKTLDAAFAGLTIDPRVAAVTKRQPEYNSAVGAYINSIASPARISGVSDRERQWRQTLDAVEQRYGVDRWVILAIWGIETSFGANTGGFEVIRSLATLAAIGYRSDYFREELLAALKVLQDGHVSREKMIGSWAGAMGQPQFMPSNFEKLAVDFDKNGKKDIWTSVPDVLGSIGHYFQYHGWKRGMDWGYEVAVSADFDYYGKSRDTFAEWTARGVTRADGKPFPEGDAILLFPSGAAGPAFLVTENFSVIKRYNISDSFALAAGQIMNRARGMPPIRAAWPADDRQLSREQRMALQKRLSELGHRVNDFEGRIDFDLRDSIRAEQTKLGMRPDGHPTAELLDKIGVR
jgi:membrane-bound lytic murein transglycosylase B